MKVLSIFVDESGDFGMYNSRYAPYYIFSMVFHEQSQDLQPQISRFDDELKRLGYQNHVVHTLPLIRREYAYCNLSPNERRTIFTKLFYFAKSLPIRYKTFTIERKEYRTESTLKKKALALIENFFDEHYVYFSAYDKVILYYDNGQKQLASVLQNALSNKLSSYERKGDVTQGKYKLLQVADMLCTLQLLEIKCENNSLTESELKVFHTSRELKKDFLKKIKVLAFRTPTD